MKTVNDKIHTQLSSLVNGGARNYLQDAVITMRNGRYCIPVKAEYKGQVPGMIHDQSSTGSTLFIEPMAVVKLNNDIRELELQEQKEIEVILANLSEQTALSREEILTDLEILVQLDFIFARAALAMDMNAEVILANLSEQTALSREEILTDLEILVQLDFIFARAALAMDMNATEPIFKLLFPEKKSSQTWKFSYSLILFSQELHWLWI